MVSEDLQVPELSAEVERAVLQVEMSIQKQEEEQQQEKGAVARERTAIPAPMKSDTKPK